MKFFNNMLWIQPTWKRSHKSVGSGSEYEASLGFLWSDCNILKTLTSWKESKTCFMKGRCIRHLRLRGDWEGVVCNTVRLFWGRCRFFYGYYEVPQETHQTGTWENRKFRLENQMVRALPFGKLQKIWAVISGDAIFPHTTFSLFSWFKCTS